MILNGKTYGDPELFERARREILNRLLFEAADEHDGGRYYKAFAKAVDELEANTSLEFDGTRLIFRSRGSGRLRRVTETGCLRGCDCRGGVSYHRYLFAIVARLAELEKSAESVALTSPAILEYETGNLRISLCRVCGETAAGHRQAEAPARDALAAEIADRHAGCPERTPHPHQAARLREMGRRGEEETGRQGDREIFPGGSEGRSEPRDRPGQSQSFDERSGAEKRPMEIMDKNSESRKREF